MNARTKARKRALDIIFAAEARHCSPQEVLAGQLDQDSDRPLNPYTIELVEGVSAQMPQLDEVIATHAHGWSLARMPAVDRNLLRLAVFELTYRPQVPTAVVISEAVKLARDLSTDDSPGFINGVLAAIAAATTPAGPQPAG